MGLAATMSQAVFRSVKFTFAGFALVGFNDERGSGWTAARCVPTDQVPVTGHAQREEEINESVVYHCARSADRVPARASTVPQPSSAAVTDGVRSGTGAARLTACLRKKKINVTRGTIIIRLGPYVISGHGPMEDLPRNSINVS